MSPAGVILFTLASITTIIFMGNYYTVFKISRTIWLVITGLTITAFIVIYIKDSFFTRNEENEQ